MATISDIGGGNNDFPDLISWGNARGSSPDLEIAHVYSDQLLTSDFDHRTDFTGGYEVVGMGNDFVGDFTDTGVIRITRDPAYTSWLIDDRTGRGHWKNLIIDCTDFNVVFRGGIQRFEATNVGFRGNSAPSFDEVATTFDGVFNQCAFFTENTMAASLRNGQVTFTDCIAVGNENDLFGTVRIRDMTGTVTNTVAHERQGSLCFGADGSTVTGSGCVSTDNSATNLSIGSQDSSLPTYFEDASMGDLRINSAGQAALPASLSWAYAGGGGSAVTADVAYTVGVPTFASTANATQPAPLSDIDFAVSAPAFTASADATLPQPLANAALSVGSPTFAASASASQPVTGNWYLDFPPDGYIQISPLVSDLGADYSWDIEFRAANNSAVEFILLGESSVINNVIVLRSDNTIDYRVEGLELGFPVTDITDQSAVYRFECRGGVISLYENGSLKGAQSYSNVQVGGTNGGFAHIGNAGGTVTRGGALYYLKYTDNNNAGNNRFFNASSSGGTGTVLPDDDSGLNGSQVGTWPADDSEWVPFSDSPQADVSFAISSPSFSAIAEASLPQPLSDVSFTVSGPAFSADATVTLPNPTADISYAIGAPTFSATGAATLPQPSSDVAFTIDSPLFAATATVTEPNFNAAVDFTVSAPTFSGSASVTLPQPVVDGNFTISAPTFSVVAIVGGIAIIVDDETNINQRVLSNNINAPILSTNING